MNPNTVSSIPLFAAVRRRHRDALASLADEVAVPAGARLTRQGGYAQEFFVIVEGSAEVVRDGTPVGALEHGDFFGEVGLLGAGWQRTATVVARSPMRLLVLARREFRALLADFPEVAAPIVRAAAQRQATAGAGSLPSSST
jgi:CRP-like cAMP-binding protein